MRGPEAQPPAATRRAAIFDLDGTLLADTSSERLFLRRALREGALGPIELATGAAHAFAWWVTRQADLYAVSKAYLRRKECQPLEALGVTCVREDVRPRLRPALLTAIETHRSQGDTIVLLSGTLDFLGMAVAQLVGADAGAFTVLERRDGRFTGRVVPPYPHGAGKVQALATLARASGIDLAASTAYANHASDAAHLQMVGAAHVVAPDRVLRRIAAARGWRIHDDAATTTCRSGPTQAPRPDR